MSALPCRRRAYPFVIVSVALAAGILSACSGAPVDAYPLRPGTQLACEALVHDVTPRVAGLKLRPVEDAVAAAWGDPPVVLRCGIDDSISSARLVTAHQSWAVDEAAHSVTYTSTTLDPTVSVQIPRGIDAERALDDLAATLDKHTQRRPQVSASRSASAAPAR